MTPLSNSLKLCALSLAIAALSGCGGGGDDTTVTENDCSTTTPTATATPVAAAPAASPAATPVAAPATTSASRRVVDDDDDENDDDDDDDGDHDKRALVKAASGCPATPIGTTAAAPGDSGTPTTTTAAASPAPAPAPAASPAPAPAPSPAPAPAPAASTAALNGKSLYAANCASCHGSDPTRNISKILKGTSASNTLSAIASNKGGMGYLRGTIGAAQANDIAAYLARPNI